MLTDLRLEDLFMIYCFILKFDHHWRCSVCYSFVLYHKTDWHDDIIFKGKGDILYRSS